MHESPAGNRPFDPADWRRPLVRTAVAIAALAVFAGSCGDDDAPDAATADADGAALYAQNCASCHGSDLRGTATGPSHLSVVYEADHHGDDSFRSAVANGASQHHWNFGDMAPVPGLDADQIDAIIDFVRGAQDEHGFEPYPP